jgi:hypothetical protein
MEEGEREQQEEVMMPVRLKQTPPTSVLKPNGPGTQSPAAFSAKASDLTRDNTQETSSVPHSM